MKARMRIKSADKDTLNDICTSHGCYLSTDKEAGGYCDVLIEGIGRNVDEVIRDAIGGTFSFFPVR